MLRGEMTTLCRPRGEPGDAKASDSTASTTSLALAKTMAITPCRSLYRRRFVVRLKAQAYRL